mmetsp:Transcript_30981/g.72983  ORF Transcript_30981/g.72983 Transcript_30981/m.72983 type:complete len:434 (-) Transcript_30981:634-1935(-)
MRFDIFWCFWRVAAFRFGRRRRRAVPVANRFQPPGRVPHRLCNVTTTVLHFGFFPVHESIGVSEHEFVRQGPQGCDNSFRVACQCVLHRRHVLVLLIFFFNGRNQLHGSLFERVLALCNVLYHVRPLEIGNVVGIAGSPKRAFSRKDRLVPGPKRLWNVRHAHHKGSEDGREGRRGTKPQHGTGASIRWLLALNDVGGTGSIKTNRALPIPSDGAFIGPFLPSIRCSKRSTRKVSFRGQIKLGPPECVTMESKQIALRQGLVGFHREGVDRIGLQIGVIGGKRLGRSRQAVGRPHSSSAVELVGVFSVRINFGEIEQAILLHRRPPPVVHGNLVDTVTHQEPFGVLRIDLANDKHIGNDRKLVVVDFFCSPDRGLAGRIRQDVKDPSLLRVGYRKGFRRSFEFSGSIKPVSYCQVAHELDSLFCSRSPLHSYL